MTPDERQLINGLFDRMRSFGPVEKDRDAESLIKESVRQIPDAPYMLVQSVLVQEQALQQADQRIRVLEDQVRELESRARPQQAGGGSFLGGLFGGSRPQPEPAAGRGSVPPIGRPDARARTTGAVPEAGPAPWQAQQGGGFLRSAMATAAGVAGGMLLANSISSMLGGQSGSASASPSTGTSEAANQTAASEQTPQYQDASDNDPGNDPALEDASYDDGGDWGGGDLDI